MSLQTTHHAHDERPSERNRVILWGATCSPGAGDLRQPKVEVGVVVSILWRKITCNLCAVMGSDYVIRTGSR